MRALLMIVIASATLAAQTGAPQAPQVTSQDLLDGLKDPTRWLTYGGNYSGQRNSPPIRPNCSTVPNVTWCSVASSSTLRFCFHLNIPTQAGPRRF